MEHKKHGKGMEMVINFLLDFSMIQTKQKPKRRCWNSSFLCLFLIFIFIDRRKEKLIWKVLELGICSLTSVFDDKEREWCNLKTDIEQIWGKQKENCFLLISFLKSRMK